jgi:hypothetical protein
MITYKPSDNSDESNIGILYNHYSKHNIDLSNQSSISFDAITGFSLDIPNYMDFSKCYYYIDRSNESFFNIFNLCDKILSRNTGHHVSAEGFIESTKSIAKRVVRIIIMAVKAVINWLKTVLMAFGRFVRDKIFHKLFGKKPTKETLVKITEAYDKYGDVSICNPFNDNAFSKEDYDTEVSYSDDEIPPLSDSLKESLRYMNYKTNNFDIIGRTAAMAATAIDSMVLALKKSKDDNGDDFFVRNYQVRYGNQEEENDYLNYTKDNPLTTLSLYFYHEKSFMQFIYHIDKLTNGNLSSLIIERRKYDGDPDINTSELKINLNVKGSDVAKAIILNCSLDKLKNIETKSKNIDSDKIKIKDIISKEVLLRIIAGDSVVLDKLQHEAEYSLKACEELDTLYKDFEQRLLKYEQDLNIAGTKAIKNYVRVEEANKWMNFMTTFIQCFMTNRTNMIHIIRRIIKILGKKTKENEFVNFGKNNNTPISTKLYGVIKRLDKEHWENLSYSEIVKDSKEIIKHQLINMHYNNRLPVYIIPIRKYIDTQFIKDLGLSEETGGFTTGLYSMSNNPQPNSLNRFVKIFQSTNPREIDLINEHTSYDNDIFDARTNETKYSDFNLIGCVIYINTNLYKAYGKNTIVSSLFPPSVLYYSTIIHETTHAVQNAYNVKTKADQFYNIATDNSNLENKTINENREKNKEFKLIWLTRNLSYTISPLHEREAFKEQENLLMSTIADMDDRCKIVARDVLKKFSIAH